MPPLLPRKITQTVSVIRICDVGLPRLSTGSASSEEFNEATSRFTCVTACCFANWELTTPCYQDAAPLSYRGERTTPRTGLKPVRYSTVTAYGRIYFPPFLSCRFPWKLRGPIPIATIPTREPSHPLISKPLRRRRDRAARVPGVVVEVVDVGAIFGEKLYLGSNQLAGVGGSCRGQVRHLAIYETEKKLECSPIIAKPTSCVRSDRPFFRNTNAAHG